MIPKKSKSANLENKRVIFLEIGMIVALAIVLYAFNWKTYDKNVYQTYQRDIGDIPEDMAPITQQKPPELPRLQPPPVLTVINIVDNNDEVDDEFVIDVEVDATDSVSVYVPVPKMQEEESGSGEEEIFKVVESPPMYPGGEEALYSYLANNTRYPQMAKDAGISGRVYLTFVVEKDGHITDARVLRGIGGGCDEEALRVINAMPKWTPGLQRNRPVRVQFVMDIKFTLSAM